MRASAALCCCPSRQFAGIIIFQAGQPEPVNAGRDYFVPFPVFGTDSGADVFRHRHIGKQGIALKQIACFTKLRLAVDPFRGRIEGFVPEEDPPAVGRNKTRNGF